ncbi:hypothetical protein FOS14_00045 [Skermania sp. ID1734]|uniref:DUF6642 family protein n=1 Tax=Skermania sp. ID1734 TaxID=2597516 RepID=UPI0011816654|nr:DUF6642 family protein [Skermania sp. ID1734]TSE01831.1 hypothetical protein FOS14_00045 [Skermania sp. ID1734]
MKGPGVLCLEGDWDQSLESRLSIETALRLLENNHTIRLVHRDVGTRAELDHYVDRWLGGKELKGFDLIYLGFHGSAESFYIGDVGVSLDEFADLVDGRGTGKVFYFASCEVLAAEDDVLTGFCRRTGARAIAGYTRMVGWVEAAAFELLLVSALVSYRNMKAAYTGLRKEYPELTTKLGFRMAHANWASERSIAVAAAAS